MKKKVLVWLSGWVDSAVSAALLLDQWYEVVGWFMKNYVSDKWNCTTFKDAEEAIKVAKFLWIELLSFDLQKEYQERIIDYIFEWYSKWITPNPDVLCNNLIKFDVFLNKAMEQWFDYIATGHYARITTSVILNEVKDLRWDTKDSSAKASEWQIRYHLLQWIDSWKDQSYFLSGLNQYQLSKSIFPLWEMTKQEVREKAKEIWLPNAERKDSQGLCFIWNVPIRTFLMQKFPKKEW
jgi:tRNA-specific 2-thiouridylase